MSGCVLKKFKCGSFAKKSGGELRASKSNRHEIDCWERVEGEEVLLGLRNFNGVFNEG